MEEIVNDVEKNVKIKNYLLYNAWSESFFAILEKEIIHWHFYPTREQVRQAKFEYIEVFYNRKRAQKRLGYLSPVQYLEQWQKGQLQTAA